MVLPTRITKIMMRITAMGSMTMTGGWGEKGGEHRTLRFNNPHLADGESRTAGP
jgi:hypothetical protein